MKKYQVGDIITGIVTGIKPYGSFVHVDEEYTGLVHISEISDGFVRNVEDFMKMNESVQLKILEIDEGNRHMKLSLKSIADVKRTPRRYMQFSKDFRKDVETLRQDFTHIHDVIEEALLQKEEEKVVRVQLDHFYPLTFESWQQQVIDIHNHLHNIEKSQQESFGWVDYPNQITPQEIEQLLTCAQSIRSKHNTLVICGTGGSYLGARAGIEMLTSYKKDNKVEIIYFGHTLSSAYANATLEYLKTRDFVVNVISKSGTTLESAIGFRLLRNLLIQKYGEEQSKARIIVTTDPSHGALRKYAQQKNLLTFSIPSSIGGRYSVLTSVGLLPFAVAGIDIVEMIAGSKKAYLDLSESDIAHNEAYRYAIARLHAHRQGKTIEALVTYEPQLLYLTEWWKQLYGESEGKNGQGLFPAGLLHTGDLHSLGQWMQDGPTLAIETVLHLFPTTKEIILHESPENFDGLNEYKNQTLLGMNQIALQGTIQAHAKELRVPHIMLMVNRYDAFGLGYLFYFFMKSCAMSSYLFGVNPFDQPGVEVYKRNILRLLGKKDI